mmetsp:Transcript_134554/g.429771  ORF Transcript_134554/g.429771 Transcript_134554/m.429771 type:complete len:579 (+) Transcript_134554:120-1856(+)
MGLSTTAYNVLVACMLATVALTGATLLVRRLLLGFRGSLKQVVAHCASAALQLRQLVTVEDGDGCLAIHIRSEVARQRAALAKTFTTCACLAGILYLLMRASVTFAGRNIPEDDVWQDWVLIVASILFLCVDSRPHLLNGHVMRVVHCVLMALLMVFALPWSGPRMELYQKLGSISPRLFLGVMHLEIRVSFWTNAVFSLGLMCCLLALDPSVTRVGNVVDELVFLVMMITTLFCFEVTLTSSAATHVNERSMQGQYSAVTSLLNMVCDAVVELDDDLRMAGDCPALSTALFRSQTKGLFGQLLKQFVFGDDQAHFEDQIASQDSPAAAAKMFHVRLSDSWGNAVPMELFHVPFSGVGEEPRHLIGLREHSDTHIAASLPKESQTISMDISPSVVGAPLAHHGPGLVPEGDDSNLQVDVLAADPMTITFASPKFKNKYRPVDAFEELLPQPQEFRQWLISTADAVWSGSRSPDVCHFGGLVVGKGGKAQLRLVMGNFVHPDVLGQGREDPNDRSSYRASVRLGGRLSSGTGSSSSSSRSRGTSSVIEPLSLGHARIVSKGSSAHGLESGASHRLVVSM